MQDIDVIVIGSGIGGLVAGAMLARYGKCVLICESHTIAGGVAHSFVHRGFHFDSGAFFYYGLTDPQSFNPLRQVFNILEESIVAISYDPLGHYHFPEGSLPIYSDTKNYLDSVSNATIWDPYAKLLRSEDVPDADRKIALSTPAVDSLI